MPKSRPSGIGNKVVRQRKAVFDRSEIPGRKAQVSNSVFVKKFGEKIIGDVRTAFIQNPDMNYTDLYAQIVKLNPRILVHGKSIFLDLCKAVSDEQGLIRRKGRKKSTTNWEAIFSTPEFRKFVSEQLAILGKSHAGQITNNLLFRHISDNLSKFVGKGRVLISGQGQNSQEHRISDGTKLPYLAQNLFGRVFADLKIKSGKK
ncbi:MAG: hypothetical protein Q7K42_03240 [Candidatus Diapherotrites archaeon]|nr:hypothetical protein [Candidatus Diapherotrites archaeon]